MSVHPATCAHRGEDALRHCREELALRRRRDDDESVAAGTDADERAAPRRHVHAGAVVTTARRVTANVRGKAGAVHQCPDRCFLHRCVEMLAKAGLLLLVEGDDRIGRSLSAGVKRSLWIADWYRRPVTVALQRHTATRGF